MTERVRVLLQRLDPDVPLPRYAKDGDAGADLPIAQDLIDRLHDRYTTVYGQH